MARIRSINPVAPTDEDVATMSVAARLVWAYLPCHADREGRLKDSPFMLKVALLPADNVDMDEVLNELADRRHIVRYQTSVGRFIQIRNFKKYQNPHKNEVSSTIPAPIEKLPESFTKLPEHSSTTPEKDRSAPAVRSGPDPIRSESSPSPDPVPVSVPRNEPPGKIWDAYRWLQEFKAAFWLTRGQQYGAGSSDAKAQGELKDLLVEFEAPSLLAAQARAPAMFAEYLADDGKDVVKARHCFAFFVTRWNGLRLPAQTPSPHHPKNEVVYSKL